MNKCSFPDFNGCTMAMKENVLVCSKCPLKYYRVVVSDMQLTNDSREKTFFVLFLQDFGKFKMISK